MTSLLLRSIATLLVALLLSTSLSADIRDDYEFTVADAVKADQVWQLYQDEKFAGSFNKGHYTDLDPKTKVNDFWSDGLVAKLDRDNNGHFETIFIVTEKQLFYTSSIGRTGGIIHVAKDYKKYLGQPASSLIQDIQREYAR